MLDYTILSSFPHSGLLAAAAVFDGGKWASTSCVERKKGKREGLSVGRAHQSKERMQSMGGCNTISSCYRQKGFY